MKLIVYLMVPSEQSNSNFLSGVEKLTTENARKFGYNFYLAAHGGMLVPVS